MSYKITCNRLGCQHCHKHHCTAPNIEIDDNGQCLSLKKSIVYYIGLVWRALKHSNFIIVFPSFSDELRYGLYVVMSMYDLTFSTDEVRGLITLYQGENGPLNAAEIVDLPVNNEKFSEIVADFNENGPIVPQKSDTSQPKPEPQPWGWLAPNGVFTEADWGDHEEVADTIIHQKDWLNDWTKNWREKQQLKRDYLVYERNYVLIHNPQGIGADVITRKPGHPLTKAQREYLFDHFTKQGSHQRAKEYLEDE